MRRWQPVATLSSDIRLIYSSLPSLPVASGRNEPQLELRMSKIIIKYWIYWLPLLLSEPLDSRFSYSSCSLVPLNVIKCHPHNVLLFISFLLFVCLAVKRDKYLFIYFSKIVCLIWRASTWAVSSSEQWVHEYTRGMGLLSSIHHATTINWTVCLRGNFVWTRENENKCTEAEAQMKMSKTERRWKFPFFCQYWQCRTSDATWTIKHFKLSVWVYNTLCLHRRRLCCRHNNRSVQ